MFDNKDKIYRLRVLRNFIYGGALFCLTSLLVLQVYKCLEFYLDEPTYFASNIVPQQDAEFPAMTACPEERLKDHVLMAHGIPERKIYNEKKNMTWSSNDTTVSERQLFDLVTFPPQEVYKYILIRFFKAGSNGKFYIVMRPNSTGGPITEQRHRSFGKCYTLHPEPWMAKLGIYYIKYRFHIPVKIYFHGKNQYLDLSGRMGYKFYPGETIQAQVNYQDMRLISRLNKKGNITCTYDDYDECMYSALEKRMMDEYGCVAPYIISREPVCTKPEAVNGTFWIAWNRVTNQHNDCVVPCKAFMVSMSGRNMKADKNAHGTVFFYFSQRLVLNEEHYFYSFMSTVGEIGGYVGLLLGVSLMNGASWFCKFLDDKAANMMSPPQRFTPVELMWKKKKVFVIPEETEKST